MVHAPLTTLGLLRFLSGVPILERRFKKKYPEFKDYMKKVNIFFPYRKQK